jgi:hypothetical protein
LSISPKKVYNAASTAQDTDMKYLKQLKKKVHQRVNSGSPGVKLDREEKTTPIINNNEDIGMI